MTSKSESDLKNTNDAIKKFLEFLFSENSWLTWLHIIIFFMAVAIAWWLARLSEKAEEKRYISHCNVVNTPCNSIAKGWLEGLRQSNSQFIYAFSIGAIAFMIGVWFESNGSGGMLVQVATYLPAIVLALSQILGIYQSSNHIKKHLGV